MPRSIQRTSFAIERKILCELRQRRLLFAAFIVRQQKGEERMPTLWTREFLARRIDRCYLIAAWTKVAEKRRFHLELARHYRAKLASIVEGSTAHPA